MRARVIYMVPALWCLATPSLAAGPQVAAVENQVSLAAGFTHTDYSEHLFPSADESGFTPGATVNAAVLLPASAQFDYYAALTYRFSAGNLAYNSHGVNISGTDSAVFNTVEARFGAGLPLAHGSELIPYIAAGYQDWNRAISLPQGNGAANYRSPLAGAGAKFDLPLSNRLVVSLGAAFLLLAGGSAAASLPGINLSATSMGVTPQEHVELGLDGAAYGPLHLFAGAWVTRFNASGANIQSSTTTQTGVNLGIGYSFY